MDVYLYQAALLCEECGDTVRSTLGYQTCPICKFDPQDEETYDSDEYPKGPYPDGGGESDTPQHCDHCGLFLENPLTSDGVAYVREALELGYQDGDAATLIEWRAFYG